MQNLHKLAFLGLVGISLVSSGCTVTTTDGNSFGGAGGGIGEQGGSGNTVATGGTTATATGGANSAAGTSSVAGAAATTPTFTAADCTAAAAAAPAPALADISMECIQCLYGAGCSDSVVCHNEGTCMASTLKAIECASLRFKFNGYIEPNDVLACQAGTGETPTDLGGMTVASNDPNAWLGASVPSAGTDIVMTCGVACNLADQ